METLSVLRNLILVPKSIDVMSFNRITSAIPVKWKEKLKTRNVEHFVRQTVPHVKVKGKKVEFTKINNIISLSR